jgi:hypothetical protein
MAAQLSGINGAFFRGLARLIISIHPVPCRKMFDLL